MCDPTRYQLDHRGTLRNPPPLPIAIYTSNGGEAGALLLWRKKPTKNIKHNYCFSLDTVDITLFGPPVISFSNPSQLNQLTLSCSVLSHLSNHVKGAICSVYITSKENHLGITFTMFITKTNGIVWRLYNYEQNTSLKVLCH